MKPERKPPLVILVFDAADADYVSRWAAEGYLLTLAGLMKRGVFARISGAEHVSEHGMRMSMWSGLSRGDHGYYAIRQLKPGTYDLEPCNAHKAPVEPFWHRLGANGRKIAVIDAPETVTQPGLPGLQLMDWTTLMPDMSRFPPSAEPRGLVADVERIFGPREEFREFKPNQTFEQDRELYQRFRVRCPRYGALCRELLRRDRFDLVVVGFYEAHCASHQFWKYRPESPQGGKTDLTHGMRELYQSVDREMGLILEQLPADANVFVLSIFGMSDGYPIQELMQNFCRQLGYQPAAQTAPASPGALQLLRRTLPRSWRVAISQHLPRRVQDRLLGDAFRNATDWSKTTAFAIPNLYTGYIRVNLRGREPQGIVSPGAEYEAVLDRVEADLRQLIDPVTRAPAVASTIRTIDLYGGGPPTELPDLFVKWVPALHFLQQVEHPRERLIQQRPWYYRDNEHSAEGFLVAAGPSIGARTLQEPINVLDLAPTFLSLLGEDVPDHLTGKVLREAATA